MVPNYLILIVIYNCSIHQSWTIESLKKAYSYLRNSKVIIWDNGPRAHQQLEVDALRKDFGDVDYVYTPQNLSLAVIYNQVIRSHHNYDYLIIFDQDSGFDPDFFEVLERAIRKEEGVINLFLPLVVSNQTIVSPGNYRIIKGKYWKKKRTGIVLAKNRVAINSGMVISFDYLKDSFSGYDERLLFYGVDVFFMLEYAKKNKYFYVFEYYLKHSSSSFLAESNDMKLFRFRGRKHAWEILHEKKLVNSILVKLYTIYASLRLSLKYKDLRFLW